MCIQANFVYHFRICLVAFADLSLRLDPPGRRVLGGDHLRREAQHVAEADGAALELQQLGLREAGGCFDK